MVEARIKPRLLSTALATISVKPIDTHIDAQIEWLKGLQDSQLHHQTNWDAGPTNKYIHGISTTEPIHYNRNLLKNIAKLFQQGNSFGKSQKFHPFHLARQHENLQRDIVKRSQPSVIILFSETLDYSHSKRTQVCRIIYS